MWHLDEIVLAKIASQAIHKRDKARRLRREVHDDESVRRPASSTKPGNPRHPHLPQVVRDAADERLPLWCVDDRVISHASPEDVQPVARGTPECQRHVRIHILGLYQSSERAEVLVRHQHPLNRIGDVPAGANVVPHAQSHVAMPRILSCREQRVLCTVQGLRSSSSSRAGQSALASPPATRTSRQSSLRRRTIERKRSH
jgi:hypothetical protein